MVACRFCIYYHIYHIPAVSMASSDHRWELPGNYPYFEKYGNLPLCLENYALCSVPPIFTTILYTYPLRFIIYLEEPSGNIIMNYHGTFIHIFIHGYYPAYQKKFSETVFLHDSYKKICIKGQHFLNSYPRFLNLYTLYDTINKIFSTKNILLLISVLKNCQGFPCFRP